MKNEIRDRETGKTLYLPIVGLITDDGLTQLSKDAMAELNLHFIKSIAGICCMPHNGIVIVVTNEQAEMLISGKMTVDVKTNKW